MTIDELVADAMMTRAFERCFQIIGEATKNTSKEIREKYPEVDWRLMAKFRDRLVHHYFDVDYQILYKVVINDVPQLRIALQAILDKEMVAE